MVFTIMRTGNEGENLIQKNENDMHWFRPTKMMKMVFVNVIWVQKKRERIRNVLFFLHNKNGVFRIIRSRSNS